MEIKISTPETMTADEFIRYCLLNQTEILKLKECGFFKYQLGRISVDKAAGSIRKIKLEDEYKWPK